MSKLNSQSIWHWISVLLILSSIMGCRKAVERDGSGVAFAEFTPTPTSAAQTGKLADLVPTPTPTPTRVPPEETAIFYTVQAGDTLSSIAAFYGTDMKTLMEINSLANPDQLSVGQILQVSMKAQHTGPASMLLPDSELVFGPGYTDFDVEAAIQALPGGFEDYIEDVNGEALTGPEIVTQVAQRYSVGPRVLLTLIELRTGWLTASEVPTDTELLTNTGRYPLGYDNYEYWDGLYSQLSVAADALNAGFYGWLLDTLWLVQTKDGTYVQFSTDINAATAGVQRALAASAPNYEAWRADVTRFAQVYMDLFGVPFDYAVPLFPSDMEAPELVLPWSKGETWYYTSGPHPGWGAHDAWAALDFATAEEHIGCTPSRLNATAVARGYVAISENGLVMQDLDGDGLVETGWIVIYLHMAEEGSTKAGITLDTGDPVGHPSCEGGISTASHLHLARRYNGVWIPADDPRWPMTLSGWVPASDGTAYDGTLTKDGQTRTACECWESSNAILH